MAIEHFSHKHLLKLKVVDERENRECDACVVRISGFVYGCADQCEFYIHTSCAELPRELEHPFHPQHRLTLHARLYSAPPLSTAYATIYYCNVCRRRCDGSTYRCSECNFCLDVKCASLMPTKVSNQQKILQHVTHPHPTIICENKNGAYIECSSCRLQIINSHVYVCLECNVLLDESCARLAHEIQHPFHPPHTLTLLSNCPTVRFCSACGKDNFNFWFQCSQCRFVLDVYCASLMPIANDKLCKDSEFVSTHRHPLLPCYKTKTSLPLSCSACFLLFDNKDFVYICLNCRKLLHKSCACMPREILDHPYHPEHPLSLIDYDIHSRYLSDFCLVCHGGWVHPKPFIYACHDCEEHLHAKCTLRIAPLLHSHLHLQHPLFLMEPEKPLGCRTCGLPCYYPYLRCIQCSFILHVHCVPLLPPSIKHICHFHHLTLTHSPIKDYEDEDGDAEFLCDVCEKRRLLHETTYYCEECHFIAHVHCVISEIWPYLERKSSSLDDKTDNMKMDIAIDAKLMSDERKEEVEVTKETSPDDDGREDDDKEESTIDIEIGNTFIDSVLAEIDSEIAKLQIMLDELVPQVQSLTEKIDQLKVRRSQYMMSS